MKTFLFFGLFFLLHVSLQAQGITIQQLPCGVWGQENWTAYTEEDLRSQLFPAPTNIQDYYLNPVHNDILSLSNDSDAGYINNIQCIRWALEAVDTPYKVTISENGKRIILYDAVTTGCGLILFPDSLLHSRFSTLQVVLERQGHPTSYFSWVAMLKGQRNKWMNNLHNCGDIYQQVDLLLRYQKYREALSMLEIEKLRRGNDPVFDKLYWKTLSRIKICPLVLYRNYNLAPDITR
ncbi:MAG: hypothetical protein JWO58_630 [Chitinophagaceae bacterium]|nr:hypothetical protein [Chitinophagaceae bacterium]